MAAQTKPIPEGYHTLTPYLVVDGAEKVVRFMKEAFGAQAVFEPMMRPDGKIMHAEFKIGDSVVMIADSSERAKATSAMLHLYVPMWTRSIRRPSRPAPLPRWSLRTCSMATAAVA